MNNQQIKNTFLHEEFQKLETARSKEDIHEFFTSVAQEILKNYFLSISNQEFRIKEIEFYLKHEKANFNDVYTHEHYEHTHYDSKSKNHFNPNEHFLNGVWRFHNSGMDIAIGGAGYYGGILIRCIESTSNENQKLITGPIKSFDALLNSMLRVNQPFQFLAQKSTERLLAKNEHIYKTKRIIEKTHKNDYDNWKDQDYRYIVASNPSMEAKLVE